MASSSPSPSPSASPTPAELTPADAAGQFGSWLVSDAPLRIAGIVVGAVVVQWALSRLIRKIVKRSADKPNHERRGETASRGLLKERREQRANAIGQLVRSVVAVVIWGVALMMILPLLGIDIAPLLASAGVIGVALGFGAQTLVKDYLSGIFMILEDQFGVGDMVDLGEAVGTVEEVTLRVTRLRDQTGIVWYVRNGEILRVANRSQGWTLAIIDIPVGYNEDLEKVRRIVEAASEEMVDDPESLITEFSRPNFAGIESVSGEAVIVRVTAKTEPDDQVRITREIRQRMKLAFDAAGIKVPIVFRLPGAAGQQQAGAGQPGAPR